MLPLLLAGTVKLALPLPSTVTESAVQPVPAAFLVPLMTLQVRAGGQAGGEALVHALPLLFNVTKPTLPRLKATWLPLSPTIQFLLRLPDAGIAEAHHVGQRRPAVGEVPHHVDLRHAAAVGLVVGRSASVLLNLKPEYSCASA